MSRLWSAIKLGIQAAIEPVGFREVLLFVGAGLLAAGLALVYPPAALAVPGVVLIGVSVFGVR